MSLEDIKQKPDWELTGVSATSELYDKHDIQSDIVLGPVVLQIPGQSFKPSEQKTTKAVRVYTNKRKNVGSTGTKPGSTAARPIQTETPVQTKVTLTAQNLTSVPSLTDKRLGLTNESAHTEEKQNLNKNLAPTYINPAVVATEPETVKMLGLTKESLQTPKNFGHINKNLSVTQQSDKAYKSTASKSENTVKTLQESIITPSNSGQVIKALSPTLESDKAIKRSTVKALESESPVKILGLTKESITIPIDSAQFINNLNMESNVTYRRPATEASETENTAKTLGLTKGTCVEPGLTATPDLMVTVTCVKTEPELEDDWMVTTFNDQYVKEELLKSLNQAAENVEELHQTKPATVKLEPLDIDSNEIKTKDKPRKRKGSEFTDTTNLPSKDTVRIGSRFRIRFEGDSDTEEPIEPIKKKQKKKHKCDYCGKQFPFRSTLTNHTRIHTGEKPHKCQICHKKFSDYAVLVRHRKLHTGEKPYACDICGNSFTEKYLLKNHKLTHTGEMKYFCKECPKTFVNSSNFRRHQWVHRHKYTCDICQRKFAKKTLLASHIVGHMKPNSKVHKCDFCDKSFGMMGHLNRHLAIHMGPKEVYTCGECSKEFTQHSSLKRHVSKKVCVKNKIKIVPKNSNGRS